MDKELFERLLYEDESETLDFKKEQYHFAKATDDEKSEILKDILGFANAWRRSEAYILIGVEDIRGGRSNIVGISPTDHLNDHSLQQFVNNLTNQPVRFHYEAFGVEGKQIGIIRIDEQIRPIYLKRDYGKLSKEKVYVRRGSSTDPSKQASIEEIAQMRIGTSQPAAELLIEFSHIDRDDALGTKISWEAEYCEMPANEMIPNLQPPRQPSQLETLSAINRINRHNIDFFREVAHFEFKRRLFRPVRLVMTNIGQVATNNAWVEIVVPIDIGVVVIDYLPEKPKKQIDIFNNSAFKGFKPTFRRDPGEVEIIKNSERFRIEINFKDLQPGRRVWSDVFYIGKGSSGEFSLAGSIFADNLPQPKDFKLTISITLIETAMSVDELCSHVGNFVDDD